MMRTADLAANPEIATINPIVTGKLRPRGRFTADEAAFLQRHAPGPFKVTLPSPAMVTRKWLAGDNGRAAYPTFEALLHTVCAQPMPGDDSIPSGERGLFRKRWCDVLGQKLVRAQPRSMIIDRAVDHELIGPSVPDKILQLAPQGLRRANE